MSDEVHAVKRWLDATSPSWEERLAAIQHRVQEANTPAVHNQEFVALRCIDELIDLVRALAERVEALEWAIRTAE